MNFSTRTKRALAAGAAVIALGGGGGIALAQHSATVSPAPPSAPARADLPTAGDVPDSTAGTTVRSMSAGVDRPEAGDVPDSAGATVRPVGMTTVDAPTAGDTTDAKGMHTHAGSKDLSPGTSSIQVPNAPDASGTETKGEQADSAGEAAEQATLAAKATVSKSQAEAAAVARVSGTVKEASLGNENGNVVWEVQVTDAAGHGHEVLVDAGNSAVLAVHADAAD